MLLLQRQMDGELLHLPGVQLTPSVQELLQGMLEYDDMRRWTVDQVMRHDFVRDVMTAADHSRQAACMADRVCAMVIALQ